MKTICMFDLPVETASEKRAYRLFRKNLINEGFLMIQYSVYVRTCPTREYANRLEARVRKFTPDKGNIRLLCVTEKQYNDMKLIVGNRRKTEEFVGNERLLVI